MHISSRPCRHQMSPLILQTISLSHINTLNGHIHVQRRAHHAQRARHVRCRGPYHRRSPSPRGWMGGARRGRSDVPCRIQGYGCVQGMRMISFSVSKIQPISSHQN